MRRKIIYSRADHSIINDKKSSKLSALCQSIVFRSVYIGILIYASLGEDDGVLKHSVLHSLGADYLIFFIFFMF